MAERDRAAIRVDAPVGEGDIEQLNEEIGKRQARGERPPEPRPDDNAPKAL